MIKYKMISDTIDILDAEIVNFGVKYEIMISIDANRFDTINECNRALTQLFSAKYDIGEPISISDVYRKLQRVAGVIDTTSVEIGLKSGGVYSESNYDFEAALSSDGRSILAETNVIFELKYPSVDIEGSVR